MVFLDEGRIVEQGPTADVFASPKSGRTKRFLEEILVS
jgi:D-methionine transport system ATP-binding protein